MAQNLGDEKKLRKTVRKKKDPTRAVQALQRRNAGVSEGTPQYGSVL